VRARKLQADALAQDFAVERGEGGETRTLGVAFLISAIARSLVMEQGLGVTAGHAEAVAIFEAWLQQLRKPARKPAPRSASATS
jgi:hypothetical protein